MKGYENLSFIHLACQQGIKYPVSFHFCRRFRRFSRHKNIVDISGGTIQRSFLENKTQVKNEKSV